jgi:hypothetical protein
VPTVPPEFAGYTPRMRPGSVGVRPLRVASALLALAALGCERPPLVPPVTPPPPGRVGPLALELFTQDRPAIGGKWYDYDPDGHTLAPKPEAWIVREPAGTDFRHAAFRILSVYEEDRAESGLFTLGVALHDGGAWGPERTWAAPRNVKDTGPLCVDLFRAGTAAGDDVDCAGDGWQLRLTMQNRLSTLAGIAVGEPALFVRSVAGTSAFGAARIARVEGSSLSSLPDPAALSALDDEPPASWDDTEWSFQRFAPDLPEAGMAVGPRLVEEGFVGRPDVLWLMTARFELVRLRVVPVTDGEVATGLRVTWSAASVDRQDWSAPEEMPAPRTIDIAMPAAGDAAWLSFAAASLVPDAVHLEGVSWPFSPPRSTRYDLAVERSPDRDRVRLLLSPGAAIFNATQRGFDEDVPPVLP